mgnify:CR=1 FL=1
MSCEALGVDNVGLMYKMWVSSELDEFMDKLDELEWFFPNFAVNGETRRVEGQLGKLGQLRPLNLNFDSFFDQVVIRGYLR